MLSPGSPGTDRMGKPTASNSTGSVRIVAGRLRGSKLVVADGLDLRPTPDRVRETLFNWLAPVITGARCLDLYAGTGALGIEALSRGAGECVFVERDRLLCKRLEDNLVRLCVDNARVVADDASAFLGTQPTAFDLVFLDPPFPLDLWSATAQRLEQDGWLAERALIHVESPAGAAFALPRNWAVHRQGRAGSVAFALYRRVAPDPLS